MRASGFLVVATAAAEITAPAMAAGDAARGAQLFQQRCTACHSVAPGGAASIGPNLRGVVGRKSASTTFNYSPALQKLGVTWTPAELDSWLTSPLKKAPGTRMYLPTPNPQDRADLIAYLATLKR